MWRSRQEAAGLIKYCGYWQRSDRRVRGNEAAAEGQDVVPQPCLCTTHTLRAPNEAESKDASLGGGGEAIASADGSSRD